MGGICSSQQNAAQPSHNKPEPSPRSQPKQTAPPAVQASASPPPTAGQTSKENDAKPADPRPAAAPAATPPPAAPIVSKVSKKITLLHFNDVYNIEPGARDPVGGASRLAHVVKSFKDKDPMVLFGGDAYNPSLMSTITFGKQMVPILNNIGVHVSVMGNHDFDYGAENMIRLNKECNFPWLMANVLCKDSDEPFAEAQPTWEVTWSGGIKVGVVGLVEGEWLETLGAVNPADMRYQDFIEVGRKHAQQLRAAGCDIIIALTHMREPNDRLLCSSVPEFDILMGGHDHHYVVEAIEPHGNLMVKSGTEWRWVTKVEVELPEGGGKPKVTWEKIDIVQALPEDPEVKAIVDEYAQLMGAKMDEEVALTLTDLDGCFQTVRNAESNLGDFVCDVWRKAAHADIVILNSGSLRSDQVHPKGRLTARDFVNILPMVDCTVVLEATGEQVLNALENGVSQWPKLEGRFPQVSGIRFAFDPSKPSGARVVPGSVFLVGEGDERTPLDPAKKYKLATKEYLANGKDGYDVFTKCKVLVDAEAGVAIPTAIRNHLTMLDVLSKMGMKSNNMASFAHKWSRGVSKKSLGQSTKPSDGTGAADAADSAAAAVDAEDDEEDEVDDGQAPVNALCVRWEREGRYAISPLLDGRIINVSLQPLSAPAPPEAPAAPPPEPEPTPAGIEPEPEAVAPALGSAADAEETPTAVEAEPAEEEFSAPPAEVPEPAGDDGAPAEGVDVGDVVAAEGEEEAVAEGAIEGGVAEPPGEATPEGEQPPTAE